MRTAAATFESFRFFLALAFTVTGARGAGCHAKPRTHPLWLKRKLATNVRVEFDATPTSANADVKAELFGDGCAFDVEGRDYTSTAYVAVLGAHSNSEHWLARMFEHGADAKK